MRVRYLFSSRKTRQIDPFNQHKIAVPKQVSEIIRISDVVLEVLDARFLDETRNKEMEVIIKELNKKVIYVLNKADLVDIVKLKEEAERKELFPYVIISAKKGIGKGTLIERIKIEAKRNIKDKTFKIAHIGIIGYPNTGKSTLINFLTGRKAAGTSRQAGFTKGKKQIRLSKGILLLDTPGVLPEKENSQVSTKDLKKYGRISVETYDKVRDPELIVDSLVKANPGLFESYYKIDARGDSEILIEQLGRRNHFLIKGNLVDTQRTSRLIIKDWQESKVKK
ncbi:50S ribosome-binding GTPase [Candidatus Pacearchaeota archaeon]|nr:50S ribosome-binding GTPase [Candidatus Pacearchaeota archaeon]